MANSSEAIPIFSGENYDHWVVKMRTIFISKDLWDYIEEGFEEPEDVAALEDAEKKKLKQDRKKDAKALSFLQQGVSEELFSRIMRATKSKEAWEILQKEFQGDLKVKNLNRKEPLSAEGGDPARLVARRDEAENELVSCMEDKMLLYSGHDVPHPYAVCIYKVPEKLHQVNEDTYTPRIVSIGPYHHGKPHLQAMELYKWRCLDRFLKRCSLRLNSSLVKFAMNMEIWLRACYHDSFDHLTTQEFSEMVMLDGIFIVEVFLENHASTETGVDEYAEIFDVKYMKNDILHDMLLLENQLPLFVLQELCRLVSSQLSINDLAHEYFKKLGMGDTLEKSSVEGKHLLDFLRNCCRDRIPKFETSGKLVHTSSATELREAGVKFSYFSNIPIPKVEKSGKLVHTSSATELREAGVKFSYFCNIRIPKFEKSGKLVHTNSASNIDHENSCNESVRFDPSEGILTILEVIVNEWTHTVFGNLIAFEQCGRGKEKEITSFIILMYRLIKTSEDVDLLVKARIIVNFLGDNKLLVVDLFNNLYKEIVTDSHEYFSADVCERLNEYSRDYWHQWKAALLKWKRILRQDYFNNPWSTTSVIAAVILLALTAIQTASSIVQM